MRIHDLLLPLFFGLFINDFARDQHCGVKVGIVEIDIRGRHNATFKIFKKKY